jgi:hypothetical protein
MWEGVRATYRNLISLAVSLEVARETATVAPQILCCYTSAGACLERFALRTGCGSGAMGGLATTSGKASGSYGWRPALNASQSYSST